MQGDTCLQPCGQLAQQCSTTVVLVVTTGSTISTLLLVVTSMKCSANKAASSDCLQRIRSCAMTYICRSNSEQQCKCRNNPITAPSHSRRLLMADTVAAAQTPLQHGVCNCRLDHYGVTLSTLHHSLQS